MTRRVAVVTGASGGIGRWIARGLAEAGLHVVLIGRDAARLSATRDWIAAGVAEAALETISVDLSSLRETRRIGQDIASRHPQLALLVNNAGIFLDRRQTTPEGRERVLAINHLSPFVLTDTLATALRAGAPSRLVTVGSSSSDAARIDPDDLELRRGWGMVRAYRRSKLAGMMTTFEWARRLGPEGVVANVVHPGGVATGIVRAPGIVGLAWRVMRPFLLTEQQGADTPLFVALSTDAASGLYFKRRQPVSPNRRARDADLCKRVWDATVALT